MPINSNEYAYRCLCLLLNKSNKTDREITDECNESEILLIN